MNAVTAICLAIRPLCFQSFLCIKCNWGIPNVIFDSLLEPSILSMCKCVCVCVSHAFALHVVAVLSMGM